MKMFTLNVVVIAVLNVTAAAEAQIQLLGAPPSRGTRVTGLSADGRVVVGFSVGASGGGNYFRWTPETGRIDGGLDSPVFYDVSHDGTTNVGMRGPSAGLTPFRSRILDVYEDFPRPSGINSTFAARTRGVNNDGTVVVGHFSSILFPHRGDPDRAFRWTETGGTEDLGDLAGDRAWTSHTVAHDISGDGNSVVGYVQREGFFGEARPFVWTPQARMTELPRPSDGQGYFHRAYANAITQDGRVIVGQSVSGLHGAILWRDGVVQRLVASAGFWSYEATAVSGDGNLVIGTMRADRTLQDTVGMIWTPEWGGLSANDFFLRHGVSVPSDATLVVTSVSSDGNTLGGQYFGPGIPEVAFIAIIPAPGTCVAGLLLVSFPLSRRWRRHGPLQVLGAGRCRVDARRHSKLEVDAPYV